MNTYPPEFEDLWNLYPKRPGNPKWAAFKEWEKQLKHTPHETIMEGVRQYAEFIKREKDTLVCHARTWLHQRRWEADYGIESKKVEIDLNQRANTLRKFGIGDFWGAVECLKQGLISESELIEKFGGQAQNWLRMRGSRSKVRNDPNPLEGG